jgi:hypothetical protein
MEPVPETLYSNELTWLCAREDYIESCRRESFKTYIVNSYDTAPFFCVCPVYIFELLACFSGISQLLTLIIRFLTCLGLRMTIFRLVALHHGVSGS